MGATCYRCKKQLKGKDLARLNKVKENKSLFEFQHEIPRISLTIAEIEDYRDSIFYCQDCINQVENWEQKDKYCITCNFILMNFVALPRVPDIYCRLHDNKAVSEPKEESCKDWLLGELFKKYETSKI